MATVRERYQLLTEPEEGPPSPAVLRQGLQEATAAIVTLSERIDAQSLSAASRLKVVANYAVGYNNIDLAAARHHSIVVTNTPDVLTDATADLTWALILATARRVVEGDALVRAGDWTGWSATQLLGAEVAGRTLGIIGMGRIGQAVAHRAVGFRMPVHYYNRGTRLASPPGAQWVGVSLPDLLRDSDFVSVHVPLTEQTRHLIGASELAAMKQTTILINTARGPIVDEAALVDALERRTIAGAGLDVYEDEPRLHPGLSSLPHVVLLPHLGSATWYARVQMGMICLRNVDAVLAGRPAPNPVL